MFNNYEKYDFPKLGYIRIPKAQKNKEDLDLLGVGSEITDDEFLYKLATRGFDDKIKAGVISEVQRKEYLERLEYEYSVISKLKFSSYLLLVRDVINFCDKNDILTGYARGSCGGCLILFLINVIKINPLESDLLFDRFISAARTETKEFDGDVYIASSSLPDIDCDSDRNKKHLVNQFLESLYPNRTAAIKNISTFQSKALLKDCYKILENASEDDAKHVSDMIETVFGHVSTIKDSIENNPKFKEWSEAHKNTTLVAAKLIDFPKNSSVHASGILLSDELIDDVIPLELASDGRVVTCYDMNDAQMFGIKYDNLGLKNLGIIDECLKMVSKSMSDINLHSESIYQFLNTKDQFYGIFQAEEGLGKNILRRLECKCLDDICISIAIGRPGSMAFTDEIITNKKNGTFRKLDDRIDIVLASTYGVIIYQEQIMKLCDVMAGFTPQERDGVRKAVGKKLVDKMKSYKDKFIKQSLDNGFKPEIVDEIWSVFEKSGNYLFNASHARGYGSLTAATAYMKSTYPVEYFTCLLNATQYEQKPMEEIAKIQSELPHFNIKLLPPDLLKSNIKFSVEDGNIRFGLSFIKGVSEKTIEKINQFKNSYSNKFEIFQAANEAGVGIGVLSSLLQSGCLDSFIDSADKRTKLVLEAQLWNLLTDKEKKLCHQFAKEYDYQIFKLVKDLNIKLKDEKSKPHIKDSRFATIKKHYLPYKEIYEQNNKNGKFANWYYENLLLGFSYSHTLKEIFSEKQPDLLQVKDLLATQLDRTGRLVGVVKESRITTAKNEKKTKFIKMIVADETGEIPVLMFNTKREDKIQECLDLNGKLPEEGEIVIVRGTKKKDCIFSDVIASQNYIIYTKLSQLKSKNDTKDILEQPI